MDTVQSFESVSVTREPHATPINVPTLNTAKNRLASIDRLRGLVIVLMALDHVRDYFSNFAFDPTDLQHTTPELFLTRWVTHYCAPTFVFLAGTSASLLSLRTSRGALQRFLLSRGAWLVLLEFSVVNFVWAFNFNYSMGLVMQVIWAIGASMCVLAGLVALPAPVVGGIGVLLIAGHNLLDGIAPQTFGVWAPLWNIVHVSGRTPFGMVLYPLVPWVGVIACGYAFGAVYTWDAARRQRALLALGGTLCLAFIGLRLLNGYGDPKHWSMQPGAGFSVLSFLNVTKYPPSLAYLLMTLGPTSLLLALFERTSGRLMGVLETFGRVPLFAYVVHLALAHLLAGLLGLMLGLGSAILTNFFVFYPDSWGFGLGGVYCAWLVVLALLYPLCAWFAALKRRRSDWWLAYL
jgi:uncharacterized membrane protein